MQVFQVQHYVFGAYTSGAWAFGLTQLDSDQWDSIWDWERLIRKRIAESSRKIGWDPICFVVKNACPDFVFLG
ncbi:hypothetical protein HHUSO_G12887 [Huso huso]|uniref:Uncharacterized protein n=1 Tax=Huso huso TaxID=61971 RepID=A0ABR0ZJJ3_HUSHU